MDAYDGSEVAEVLGLAPLPREGGLYRQTWRDAHSTAIYYLLVAPDFSAFHRLPGMEAFHWYGGDPARLTMLHDGGVTRMVMGMDLGAGQRPQAVVPGGAWQALETLGRWSLFGTTMAPGYRDEDFELADAASLVADWPDAADDVERLTRR